MKSLKTPISFLFHSFTRKFQVIYTKHPLLYWLYSLFHKIRSIIQRVISNYSTPYHWNHSVNYVCFVQWTSQPNVHVFRKEHAVPLTFCDTNNLQCWYFNFSLSDNCFPWSKQLLRLPSSTMSYNTVISLVY